MINWLVNLKFSFFNFLCYFLPYYLSFPYNSLASSNIHFYHLYFHVSFCLFAIWSITTLFVVNFMTHPLFVKICVLRLRDFQAQGFTSGFTCRSTGLRVFYVLHLKFKYSEFLFCSVVSDLNVHDNIKFIWTIHTIYP